MPALSELNWIPRKAKSPGSRLRLTRSAGPYLLDAPYQPVVKLYFYPVRVVWGGGEDPADNPVGQLAAGLILLFNNVHFTAYLDVTSLSSIWHRKSKTVMR